MFNDLSLTDLEKLLSCFVAIEIFFGHLQGLFSPPFLFFFRGFLFSLRVSDLIDVRDSLPKHEQSGQQSSGDISSAQWLVLLTDKQKQVAFEINISLLCKLCFPDLEAERLGSTASIRGRTAGRKALGSASVLGETRIRAVGCAWSRGASCYRLELGSGQLCISMPKKTVQYLNAIWTLGFGGGCAERRRRGAAEAVGQAARGACSPQLAQRWSLPAHLPLCCGCLSAVTSSSAPRPAVGVPNGLSCPLPSLCHTVLSRYKDFPVP